MNKQTGYRRKLSSLLFHISFFEHLSPTNQGSRSTTTLCKQMKHVLFEIPCVNCDETEPFILKTDYQC